MEILRRLFGKKQVDRSNTFSGQMEGTQDSVASDPGASAARGAEHAILSNGNTQYILTDISRARLKQGMPGSQLAWGLDIRSESQINELFSTGKTETTDMLLGQKRTVTLTWCKCNNPASHKRRDAAQLGL